MKSIQNIVVQIAVRQSSSEVINQIKQLGIFMWIPYGEAFLILYAMIRKQGKANDKFPVFSEKMIEQGWKNRGAEIDQKLSEYISVDTSKEVIMISMPPKTGNNTIEQSIKNRNDVVYLRHHAKSCNMDVLTSKYKKIKVVTAVREPISQNLAMLFQNLGSLTPLPDLFLYSFGIYNQTELLYENGGNIQKVFDQYTTMQLCSSIGKQEMQQQFIDDFCEHILDISKYEFDKEKGYSIIKEGNVEVFVYQLEKLNDIVVEFSQWVGEPITEWDKSNIGEDKWIGKVYKQAQKELIMSEDYFEFCYNQSFVKHFYSDEDILKFKRKWERNLDDKRLFS